MTQTLPVTGEDLRLRLTARHVHQGTSSLFRSYVLKSKKCPTVRAPIHTAMILEALFHHFASRCVNQKVNACIHSAGLTLVDGSSEESNSQAKAEKSSYVNRTDEQTSDRTTRRLDTQLARQFHLLRFGPNRWRWRRNSISVTG